MTRDIRKKNIIIRVSDEEKLCIENKFKVSGCSSLSKFIRYEVMFGKIISVDNSNFDFLKRQVAGACVNINQIAHICNRNKSISVAEFEQINEVKRQLDELFFYIDDLQSHLNQELWQLQK